MSLTLDSQYPIKQTHVYTNPEVLSDVIPDVYGDMTENSGDRGILPCPKIDTVNYVHALSGQPILTEANGNSWRFWEGDGTEITSGYTVNPANDYESQGAIATVTFNQSYTDVTWQGKGIVNATGQLITNPVKVFERIVGGTASFDATNFNKAAILATDLGYVCAGAITSKYAYAVWLNNLAASFLMDWYPGQDGQLRIRLNSSTLTGLDPTFFLVERDTTDILAESYRENIRNQVPIYYAPTYAQRDRRFREGVNINYLMYDDGEASQDTISIRRYGLRNAPPLECDWTRNTTTVHLLQARLVELYAGRTWQYEWGETTKQAMAAEPGDYGVFSWFHRYDENGDRMTDRYCQLISKEPHLVGGGLRFSFRETALKYTNHANLWNGSDLVLGSGEWW